MKKTFILLFVILNFAQVNAQTKANNLNESEKIYGLSKFWSEVKYNFVYYDKLNFDWDSLYIANIENVKSTKDIVEYFNILRSMCAKLRDGHTNVYFPLDFYNYEFTKTQLQTRLIENKVVITGILNDTLKRQGLEIGMEIVNINGLGVKEFAEKFISPYVCASTKQDFINRTFNYELLRGKIDDPIVLLVKDKKGKLTEITISRKLKRQSPLTPAVDFKILENNIGYLSLNSFEASNFESQFDSVYKNILTTTALIIDIRNNGGGSSEQGYYVLKHLTKNSFFGSGWRTRQYLPSFRAWGHNDSWFSEQPEKIIPIQNTVYDKPIVVLTSERTFSAAEDFCVAFDYMKRGKLIGTATGGSTGQPIVFDLPGGGMFRVCTKNDTYPDGKEFVGIGVQPDIVVEETVKSIIENKDITIEKALEILKQ